MLTSENANYMFLLSEFVKLVKDQFCQYFVNFIQDLEIISAKINCENFRKFLSYLQMIRNSSFYLFCFNKNSEHQLSCEHTICDMCIQIYAKSNEDNS